MSDPIETDLLILGAGFSGMIMAMEARKRGFDDLLILEKADEVGGAWRENTYPGVACDIPSHLYSFASHPNPDWSTCYAGGGEIWAYMKDVAKRENLYEIIRFGRVFQSARWDGDRWLVETEGGERYAARVLVSGLGALHIPQTPDVPGLADFPGAHFHSARWDHALDLAGKRVAVIGTGASAVQFVPVIARSAAQVEVFQRTAPYVLPRPDGPIAPWVRALYRAVPALPRLRRWLIFKVFELRHATFKGDERAVKFGLRMWRKALEKAIKDKDFQQTLTPPYRIGCKRVLSSNDWYPALARDNVRVIPEALASIEGATLIAGDGTRVEADVVIWGTGFHVTDGLLRLDLRGEGGVPLAQAWSEGIEAHLGTAMTGFPNLFLLLGPHTGLGHNSVVLMIEAQAEHVGRLLETMRAQGLAAVEPRPKAQAAFETEMDDRLASMVWQAGGCTSWYQDDSGRNPTLWPGTVAEYQARMAEAGLDQYRPAQTAPDAAPDRIPQEA
ncbi:MAG: NAD(P)/FAD-dependent oxidoreductase [Pseudomonadota bacterium]